MLSGRRLGLGVLPNEAQSIKPQTTKTQTTKTQTTKSTIPGLVFNPTVSTSQTMNLELLKLGNFADLELDIGTKTWKLHRSVMCPRSKFFQKALTGPWSEAKEKCVKLPEDDFKKGEMDFILECIYSGDRSFSIERSAKSGLESCIRLYTHAEFLIIPELLASTVQAVKNYRALGPRKLSHRRQSILGPLPGPAVPISPDWVRAMEHLYKKSADVKKHDMRKSMLAFFCERSEDRRAARASSEFLELLDREPRLARDWALKLASMPGIWR